ncbi:MAG: hypothetical protein ACD_20C00425G0016 [uncultured bacterium]|nr:MAG: hypothetical protein ACD_20C00425G0016 [uncultured bacterium]HBH18536.1 hypothetical protein [Cyanobacteria bacterium UBA9579]
MKKVILNLNNDMQKFLFNDVFNSISQKLQCPVENCNGYISPLINPRFKGAASVCNKCKRAIVLRETKC